MCTDGAIAFTLAALQIFTLTSTGYFYNGTYKF